MRIRRSFPLPLAGAAFVVLALLGSGRVATAGARAARVQILDLGTLAGMESSFANDINRRGEVVGAAFTEDAEGNTLAGQALSWRGLLAFQLPPPVGGDYCWAFGNNDVGQQVGEGGTLGGIIHALLWENGFVADLGTLPGGGNSYGSDLNDRGQIVGAAFDADGHERAVLWEDGVPFDMGTLADRTSSAAVIITANGRTVGNAFDLDGDRKRIRRRAVVWSASGIIRALGELPGGEESVANFMNESGQAVGFSTNADGVRHAVAWKRQRIRDLGIPFGGISSYAGAINNRGQIAGAVLMDEDTFITVLWDGGRVTNLNALLPPGSGWENMDPFVMNDAGQLVGGGLHNGARRAFLMTIR